MRRFPIYQTKVAILANEPSPNVPSTGFAFHGSSRPATAQLLNLLEYEVGQISSFITNFRNRTNFWKHENGQEQEGSAGDGCHFDGWIDQGSLRVIFYLSILHLYY